MICSRNSANVRFIQQSPFFCRSFVDPYLSASSSNDSSLSM
ncbi:MAG: DUF2627 domain-containing protein [Serratia symbiotica]|nr:DUF2627 domain-containing protein [Serratia symbiotica]